MIHRYVRVSEWFRDLVLMLEVCEVLRVANRAAVAIAEECSVKFAREISAEMRTPPPWLSHNDGVRITLIVLLPPPLAGETDSPRLSLTRDFAKRMRSVTSAGSSSSSNESGAWDDSTGEPEGSAVRCREDKSELKWLLCQLNGTWRGLIGFSFEVEIGFRFMVRLTHELRDFCSRQRRVSRKQTRT